MEAYIKFRTHAVTILKVDDEIRCFKYNDIRCEYEVFDVDHEELAVEYILEPLAEGAWMVVIDDRE